MSVRSRIDGGHIRSASKDSASSSARKVRSAWRELPRGPRSLAARCTLLSPSGPQDNSKNPLLSATKEQSTAFPYFCRYLHKKIGVIPSRIASILRINGGEIFQQERVDRGHNENRQRDSQSKQETGCFWMEPGKLSQPMRCQKSMSSAGFSRIHTTVLKLQ